MNIKKLLASISVCLLFALLGGVLIGDALDHWFTTIKQPWFSLPPEGWYVVGTLYYIMVIIILYRVLSMSVGRKRSVALGATIALITGNELWNYLLFGLESTLAGFIGLLPFIVIVGVLFVILFRFERTTAWILFPYILWLGYDLIWTFSLWKLNE